MLGQIAAITLNPIDCAGMKRLTQKCKMVKIRGSGDDVRNQLVFQSHDAVFQPKLLFLETRNLQLVNYRLGGKRVNRVVKVTMLHPQLFKQLLVTFIVHSSL